VRLARGEHPQCHCFGRLSTGRIGVGTLVRNGALLVLVALIVAEGWGHPERLGPSRLVSPFTARDWFVPTVGVLLVAVVALQGWLLLKLMSRHGRLLVRIDKLEEALGFDEIPSEIGLSFGTEAPDFRLKGLHGETITLESLLAPGKPLMLMFTDPGCGPCATLMPDVARWQQEQAGAITLAIMTRGDSAINRATATEHGLVNVLIQEGREIADAYRSPGTPSAVLIGSDSTIRGRMVAGADAIRALIDGTGRETAAALAVYAT
jgi:thiol-disulfide isomerase/thioredoxin